MIRQLPSALVDLERSTLLTSRMTKGSLPTNLRQSATSTMSKVNRIRDRMPSTREHHVELASIYNWGSLLLFRAGMITKAEHIARHLIDLSIELYNDDREGIQWIECAIQPYINIARINASRGHKGTAQKILRDLYDWSRGETRLEFEPNGALIRQQLSEQLTGDVATVIRNCYVWDTVRTLLISRDYDEVLAFVDEMKRAFSNVRQFSESARLGLMISETAVRALIGVGDLRQALSRAREFSKVLQFGVDLNPAVLGLIPHIDYELGRSDVGRRNLDSVFEYCRKCDAPMDHSHSWYWLILHDLLYEDYHRAYSVAMQAANAAERNQDEAMEVKLRMAALMACTMIRSSSSAADYLECRTRLQAIIARSMWAFERGLGSIILGLSVSPDSCLSEVQSAEYFRYGTGQINELNLAISDQLEVLLKDIDASVTERPGVVSVCHYACDTECMDRLYGSLLSLDVDHVSCWIG